MSSGGYCFVDGCFSGTWLHPPKILEPPGRFTGAVQRRELDLLVVWRLDRPFRSDLGGPTRPSTARAWGRGLRSLQEPCIDTTTPIGEAMFHITIAWAGLEKQTLSERAGRPRPNR